MAAQANPNSRRNPRLPSPHSGTGLDRREFLYVGLVGGLGLSLGDFLRLRAWASEPVAGAGASAAPAAESLIHIFLPGGMASQESFDPKPYAPVEYRGPLGSVETAIPGVHFGELLGRTAKIADRLTIVRSMTHNEAAHERGTHTMFTGYAPSPALTYPSLGSVVSHELGTRKDLPPYVCVPNVSSEFAGSGYLSSAFGPFGLGMNPEAQGFRVRDLSRPQGVSEERFARRRRLLDAVDHHFREQEESDALDAMDSFYQRAYALMSSPTAREAFRLEAEPDAVRDRYGRHAAGQRLLLARRLVEAGTRFVSVTYGGWDHHQNISDGFRRQLPSFDQAFATLITDLEERGLLDRTLVLVTTEFGRTPKINSDGGRDHYPKVFSVVLAGGGVRRGYVHGASTPTGTDVDDAPLTAPDLAKTIYHQLGIDAEKELMAPGGRPIEIVKGGRRVEELLG